MNDKEFALILIAKHVLAPCEVTDVAGLIDDLGAAALCSYLDDGETFEMLGVPRSEHPWWLGARLLTIPRGRSRYNVRMSAAPKGAIVIKKDGWPFCRIYWLDVFEYIQAHYENERMIEFKRIEWTMDEN